MAPDSLEQLEKLASTIQLNEGPLNLNHNGIHNLVPSEQDRLQDLT